MSAHLLVLATIVQLGLWAMVKATARRAVARGATTSATRPRLVRRGHRLPRAIAAGVALATAASTVLALLPGGTGQALAASGPSRRGDLPPAAGRASQPPGRPGTPATAAGSQQTELTAGQVAGTLARLADQERRDSQARGRLARNAAAVRATLAQESRDRRPSPSRGARIASLTAELGRLRQQIATLDRAAADRADYAQLLTALGDAQGRLAQAEQKLAAIGKQAPNSGALAAYALLTRQEEASLQGTVAAWQAAHGLLPTAPPAQVMTGTDPMTVRGARVSVLWESPTVSTSRRSGLMRGPNRGRWPLGGREVSTDRQAVLYRVTAPDGSVFLELAFQRDSQSATDGPGKFFNALVTPQAPLGLLYTTPVGPQLVLPDLHIGHVHVPASALGNPSAYLALGAEAEGSRQVTITRKTDLPGARVALVIRLAGPGGNPRTGLIGGGQAPAWVAQSGGTATTGPAEQQTAWSGDTYLLLGAFASVLDGSMGGYAYLEPLKVATEIADGKVSTEVGVEAGLSWAFAPSLTQAGLAASWLLGVALDPLLHAAGIGDADVNAALTSTVSAVDQVLQQHGVDLGPALNSWLNVISEPENVSVSVTWPLDDATRGALAILDATLDAALRMNGIYVPTPLARVLAAVGNRGALSAGRAAVHGTGQAATTRPAPARARAAARAAPAQPATQAFLSSELPPDLRAVLTDLPPDIKQVLIDTGSVESLRRWYDQQATGIRAWHEHQVAAITGQTQRAIDAANRQAQQQIDSATRQAAEQIAVSERQAGQLADQAKQAIQAQQPSQAQDQQPPAEGQSQPANNSPQRALAQARQQYQDKIIQARQVVDQAARSSGQTVIQAQRDYQSAIRQARQAGGPGMAQALARAEGDYLASVRQARDALDQVTEAAKQVIALAEKDYLVLARQAAGGQGQLARPAAPSTAASSTAQHGAAQHSASQPAGAAAVAQPADAAAVAQQPVNAGLARMYGRYHALTRDLARAEQRVAAAERALRAAQNPPAGQPAASRSLAGRLDDQLRLAVDVQARAENQLIKLGQQITGAAAALQRRGKLNRAQVREVDAVTVSWRRLKGDQQARSATWLGRLIPLGAPVARKYMIRIKRVPQAHRHLAEAAMSGALDRQWEQQLAHPALAPTRVKALAPARTAAGRVTRTVHDTVTTPIVAWSRRAFRSLGFQIYQDPVEHAYYLLVRSSLDKVEVEELPNAARLNFPKFESPFYPLYQVHGVEVGVVAEATANTQEGWYGTKWEKKLGQEGWTAYRLLALNPGRNTPNVVKGGSEGAQPGQLSQQQKISTKIDFPVKLAIRLPGQAKAWALPTVIEAKLSVEVGQQLPADWFDPRALVNIMKLSPSLEFVIGGDYSPHTIAESVSQWLEEHGIHGPAILDAIATATADLNLSLETALVIPLGESKGIDIPVHSRPQPLPAPPDPAIQPPAAAGQSPGTRPVSRTGAAAAAAPPAAPGQLGQAPAQPGHVPATTSAQPGQAPANAPPPGDGQHIITVHAPTAAGPEIITSVAGPVITVLRPVTGAPKTTAGELPVSSPATDQAASPGTAAPDTAAAETTVPATTVPEIAGAPRSLADLLAGDPAQTPSEASVTTITGELDQLIKGNPATVDELALLTRVPADVSQFDTVPAVAAKIAANASANPPESLLDAALRSMPARPATAQVGPAGLISPEQTAGPGSSYTSEQLDQTLARYDNVINQMKQAEQINQLNDLINRTPSTQPPSNQPASNQPASNQADPAPAQQLPDMTGAQDLTGVNDAAAQAAQNAATGGASSSSQTIEGEVTALPGGPGGPNDINIDATGGPSSASGSLPETGIPEASGGGGFATVLNIAMLALQGKSLLDTVQQQGLQGLNPVPKWQAYSTLQNWVSSWPTSSSASTALSSTALNGYNPADPANAADLAGVVNIASNSTQGLSDLALPWTTGDPGVIDNVGSNGEPKYLVAQQLVNSDTAIAAANNPCLGPGSGCSQAQRVAAAQDWQNQVSQATTQVLANAINNYGIDSVQQPTIWQQLGATGASLGLPIPDGATDQAVVAVNSLWNSQPQSAQGQAASVAWQQANPNDTLPVQTVFIQQPSAWDTFSQGASQWLAKASSAGTTAAATAVVTGQVAVNSAWNGAVKAWNNMISNVTPQQQSPQNLDSPAAASTGGTPGGTVTSGCHGGCMAMMYTPTQLQGQPQGQPQQGLQAAQPVVQQAAQQVQQTVQNAADTVQNVAQTADTAAQNVASTVQQQAQQAAQSTAATATSDVANVAATAASDASNVATTATIDVQNAAVTAAADAARVAATASSDQQAVASTATTDVANVAATAATDAASVAATASSDQQAVASTVSSDAANAASAVSSDAQLVAQGQAAQAAQAAQQQAQQAAAAVQQQAADAATAAAQQAQQAQQAATAQAQQAAAAVQQQAADAAAAAQQQVQQAAQAAADQAAQAAAAVQQQAQQAAQAVADQAAAATQAAQQQAAQVAQAAGAAAQAVGTAVQQGVQAVGSALGIAPSP